MWGNDDRGNSIEVVGEAEFILTQEEIDEAIEEAIEEGEDEAEIEVEEVEGWVKMEYWSSDVEADDSHTLELNSPEVELTVIIDVESEEITQFETRSFFDMLSACPNVVELGKNSKKRCLDLSWSSLFVCRFWAYAVICSI